MFGKDASSDRELQKMVNRRLQRSGSQTGIAATVQHGTVTVTGKLRVEDQRITIIKALRGVNGVRQVVDQLQAPPKKQPQREQQPATIAQPTLPPALSIDEDTPGGIQPQIDDQTTEVNPGIAPVAE